MTESIQLILVHHIDVFFFHIFLGLRNVQVLKKKKKSVVIYYKLISNAIFGENDPF